MSDPAERRLRAARPRAADVPVDAADRPEALALREVARWRRPTLVTPRRGRRWALRAVAIAGLAALAAVAAGLPGSNSGPPDAMARPIALAVHWFAPAPGTVLHVRNTLASRAPDGSVVALRQESWQSVDHPERVRTIGDQDGIMGESAPDGIYDAVTDTVYLRVPPGPRQRQALKRSIDLKIAAARADGATDEQLARMRSDARKALSGEDEDVRGGGAAGDPTLAKIRSLLEHGGARVAGQGPHDGQDAYEIALDVDPRNPPPGDKPVRWTLWIAASDGVPLELRIDNGAGTPVLETTTWHAYELLRGPRADDALTVRAAHPDARVIRDADAFDAAQRRMYGGHG